MRDQRLGMRATIAAGALALWRALDPAMAHAQRVSPRPLPPCGQIFTPSWVFPCRFSEPPARTCDLAIRAIQSAAAHQDLDGDGTLDVLLTTGGALHDPPTTCANAPRSPAFESDRRDFVVGLNRADGWHGWLIRSGEHPDNGTNGWIPPLRSGGMTYFGLEVRLFPRALAPRDRRRWRRVSLWAIPPAGEPTQVFHAAMGESSFLIALDGGDLLELSERRTARVLRWDASTTRLVAEAWRRSLPLARLGVLRTMPPTPGPCVMRIGTPLELSVAPTWGPEGLALPPSTIVELLATTEARRGAATVYRVRLTTGFEGYASIDPARIPASCTALPVEQ